jgi:peptidoglycan/LPS O-acetylase OafA/YrhL
MRAIAVMGVVMVHSAGAGQAIGSSIGGRLLAHLNIGVTLFFLISGFLLYRPFIAHRAGGARAPAVGDYAKRRFLRIYPAYWVAVTALVILPGTTAVVDGHWLPMYGLVHTLPVYHGRGCTQAVDCGLAQTWSLVVELTFYVALPFYALAVGRLTRGLDARGWMWTELVTLAATSAICILLRFDVWAPKAVPGQFIRVDQVPSWFEHSLFGSAFWFALGMAMAVVSARFHGEARQPRLIRAVSAHPGILWLVAIVGYVALSAWLSPRTFLLMPDQMLVAYLAFGLIAALLLAPAVFGAPSLGRPRRFLAHPLVAWIGLISYGIFLWHYVVTVKLGPSGTGSSFPVVLASTLAISIAVAAASYYLLERPILRLKYRRLHDLPIVRRLRLAGGSP